MLFLDGDKAHVRAGDGSADGSDILRVALAAFAAHAVGGTNFGATRFSVWPCWRNRRAQWCAPEQASMPIKHSDISAMSGSS